MGREKLLHLPKSDAYLKLLHQMALKLVEDACASVSCFRG